jgi:3-oxoacyl-[acyl-carrier protein] reductase
MTNIFSLKGKTALVTGATGGIGRAIVDLLHKQGANVVMSGTKEASLEEFNKEFESGVKHIACDLSNSEDTKNLISKAVEVFGDLDILVCNAGITDDNLVLRMKDEAFDRVIDINLKSTFILNREAAKHMIRQKKGRIINIASVVAITGNFGQANYTASKAGMIAMGKSIAQEIAKKNVTVNAVAPGFIKTAMTDVLSDEIAEKIKAKIPSHEMGSPMDIAAAVAFLASDAAKYINGQTIHVNGGMVMV